MLSNVQGQDLAIQYLQRMAEDKYSSPLLLVGDDGVGKRFSVQCLARQMFCNGTHDDTCDCLHCTQLKHSVHADFVTVAPENDKDIGIDAARQVISLCSTYPSIAKARLIFIDGAERFTVPAANAILKTLEEPPRSIRFILATTSVDRVLPTIRSRCGMVRYQRLSEALVLSMLSKFESNPVKALVYARLADGSAGQAVKLWGAGRLRLRDRVVSLLKTSLTRDLIGIFTSIDELEKDKLLPLGLRFFLTVIHDIFLVEAAPDRLVNVDLVEDLRALRSRLRKDTLEQLWSGLRSLHIQQQTSSISLPFHLKTLLARTFV